MPAPSAHLTRCIYLTRFALCVIGAASLLWIPTPGFTDTPQPEQGYSRTTRAAVAATEAMAVTAHPLATKAAAGILAKGGSAVDAAIAAQLVLGLVEPQSSGLGGGAFMLHRAAANGKIIAWDGRETAPAAADENRFLNADGKAMKFWKAVVGGRSVGVPGVVAMLARAHAEHGQLPWASLFEPAITLSLNGFPVSERLHQSITSAAKRQLDAFETTRAYFFDPDGNPLTAGSTLRNPAYARTLEAIRDGGVQAFYEGAIAADIAQTVTGASLNPGDMTTEDLANYRAVPRQPVCVPYRSWRICGMGPPSSGMTTVGQIMGLLTGFSMADVGPTAQGHHLVMEASRLAFADRNRYLADADFVDVPVDGLLNSDYLARRARLINAAKASGKATAGNPPGLTVAFASDVDKERPGTTHLSIVDAERNIVSMTSSIETGFGSRLMAGGMLLNNELTDFSRTPVRAGKPVANRVQSGKRPRSSMAPTVVLDENNQPVLVLGSPGGSRIIGYVAMTLVRVLDWNMAVDEAIDYGHVVNRNGKTDIEKDTRAHRELADALTQRGHDVNVRDLNSGIHAIRITAEKLTGHVDPRREGLAAGATSP